MIRSALVSFALFLGACSSPSTSTPRNPAGSCPVSGTYDLLLHPEPTNTCAGYLTDRHSTIVITSSPSGAMQWLNPENGSSFDINLSDPQTFDAATCALNFAATNPNPLACSAAGDQEVDLQLTFDSAGFHGNEIIKNTSCTVDDAGAPQGCTSVLVATAIR